MGQLVALSIDVTKIDKTKLFVGEKGTYLKLTVSIDDAVDQFGQNVSVYDEQTKEERDRKDKKTFLGNGKTFWTDGKSPKVASELPARGAAPETQAKKTPSVPDDLPF